MRLSFSQDYITHSIKLRQYPLLFSLRSTFPYLYSASSATALALDIRRYLPQSHSLQATYWLHTRTAMLALPQIMKMGLAGPWE